jgi:hypothetical protein
LLWRSGVISKLLLSKPRTSRWLAVLCRLRKFADQVRAADDWGAVADEEMAAIQATAQTVVLYLAVLKTGRPGVGAEPPEWAGR